MELSQARDLLDSASLKIEEEKRLGNGTGTQLRLENGVKVNVFDNGTCQVQGKEVDRETVRQILGQEPTKSSMNTSSKSSTKSPITKKDVFVVYGHDKTSRDQLEAMLRRWGLNPLILDQLPTKGQTVIEKLESAIDQASFGIVLATPDDEGHPINEPDQKRYRARQNVVLELGMLLAKLGREKVAVLLKDQKNIERPSDIQGLIYIPFDDDLVKEAGVSLVKEMDKNGYSIDIIDL